MAEDRELSKPEFPKPETPKTPSTPPITPEVEKLTEKLNTIIMAAQELAYELATIDCDKADQCPLAKKSKELIRALKEFHSYVKETARRRRGR